MSDTTQAAYEAASETFVASRDAFYRAATAHIIDEVRERYPTATHLDLESSDQDNYGWCLLAVMHGEDTLNDEDENESDFEDLNEVIQTALSDLPWEGEWVTQDRRSGSYGTLHFVYVECGHCHTEVPMLTAHRVAGMFGGKHDPDTFYCNEDHAQDAAEAADQRRTEAFYGG